MIDAENGIHIGRFDEREGLENRLLLLREVSRLFGRGVEDRGCTINELRRACGFLSTLANAVDRDIGDLYLLASHAETPEQAMHICRTAFQHGVPGDGGDERANDACSEGGGPTQFNG
jgi:hypothetical protein